jgi:hypothetical protein
MLAPSVPPSELICDTGGPYAESSATLPAIVELAGSPMCPAGQTLVNTLWSTTSDAIEFIQPINPATARVSSYGAFRVCLIVTCFDAAALENLSTTCCTDLVLTQGTAPPSPTPDPSGVLCQTNGPYTINTVDLPGSVTVSGTASCPIGNTLVTVFWSSPSGQVTFTSPMNPTTADVSAYGRFRICQIVTCLDMTTQQTSSTTCCTTIDVNQVIAPTALPTTFSPTTIPTIASSSDSPSAAPTVSPTPAVCDANGPYAVNATYLPAFVDLAGNFTCRAGQLFVEAFWSSPSPDVTFPDRDNPQTAQVTAFGNYSVCQIVTCADPATGEKESVTCCTILEVNEIVLPNLNPICDTRGPYKGGSIALPGYIEFDGVGYCPEGQVVSDIYWTSESDDVRFPDDYNRDRAQVLSFGTFTVCQEVKCRDRSGGYSSDRGDYAGDRDGNNNYNGDRNGNNYRKLNGHTNIYNGDNYNGDRGGNNNYNTGDRYGGSYNNGDRDGDSYNADRDGDNYNGNRGGDDYDNGDNYGSKSITCCTTLEFERVPQRGREPSYHTAPYPAPYGRPTGLGYPPIDPTPYGSPTGLAPYGNPVPPTYGNPSPPPYGNPSPPPYDDGSDGIVCDTKGPFAANTSYLPGKIEVSGGSECPPRYHAIDSVWTSSAPEVTFSDNIDPATAVVSEYGSFEACQTVSCLDVTTGESMSKKCCTTLKLAQGGYSPSLPSAAPYALPTYPTPATDDYDPATSAPHPTYPTPATDDYYSVTSAPHPTYPSPATDDYYTVTSAPHPTYQTPAPGDAYPVDPAVDDNYGDDKYATDDYPITIPIPDYPEEKPTPSYPKGKPTPSYPEGDDYSATIPIPDYPEEKPTPSYPKGKPTPSYPEGDDYPVTIPIPGYPEEKPTLSYPKRKPTPYYPEGQPTAYGDEPVICETHGPHSAYASSLPHLVVLDGTANCPEGDIYLDAFWESKDSAVTFPVHKNPAVADVAAYGDYNICQVITCLNPKSNRAWTTKCCTSIHLLEDDMSSNGSGYGKPTGNSASMGMMKNSKNGSKNTSSGMGSMGDSKMGSSEKKGSGSNGSMGSVMGGKGDEQPYTYRNLRSSSLDV